MRPSIADEMQSALACHQAGSLADAERIYRRILDSFPGHPDAAPASNNLGAIYRSLARNSEAEACFRDAIQLQPAFAEAHYNLGSTVLDLGRPHEAEQYFRGALARRPDLAEAHNDLGNALRGQGRLDEAELSYRRALDVNAGLLVAHSNLAAVLLELKRPAESEVHSRRVLQVRAGSAGALRSLANALKDLGRLDEAERRYRELVALEPGDAGAASDLLFFLSYVPGRSAGELFEMHRDFGRRFGSGASIVPHPNSPEPGRVLRVGYVSADFRAHSAAFFIEPVLAGHDRSAFEVYCYHSHRQSDAVTARLKRHARHWRDIAALNDEALAAQVRADAIDILVDLGGHTAGNRLPAFARKPAPVQATWFGYLNTSGLDAMDWRITDARACPPGRSEALHVERLLRLPQSLCCYQPPSGCPEVAPSTGARSGAVTFGVFANALKISPAAIELWNRILASVPGSRLLVLAANLAAIPQDYAARFAERGIAADRLQLLGAQPFEAYLPLHGQVDVMLDTFPYCGGTTTCHALWMGVPVVTLAGDTEASRFGSSLLHAVGHGELVAETADGYVDAAVGLARDPKRLATLRSGMRARMSASALGNPALFMRGLEEAYRSMWRDWCVRQRPRPA